MTVKKMKINMKRKYGRYHVKTLLFFGLCKEHPYGGALVNLQYKRLMGVFDVVYKLKLLNYPQTGSNR